MFGFARRAVAQTARTLARWLLVTAAVTWPAAEVVEARPVALGAAAIASINVYVDTFDAATGERIALQAFHNLVTDAGLNLIRDMLDGDGPAGLTHFAIGTGTTAVAASQTTLVDEVLRDTVTTRTSADKTLTVKYFLPSGSGNGNTLAEIGLFNASSSGTMFARALLSPTIEKTSSIEVQFTWQITLAAA